MFTPVMIIGALFFAFGVYGILLYYTNGNRETHQVVISVAAFVIGGLAMLVGGHDVTMTPEQIEMRRWEIAHCYGHSSKTEHCIPSMRDGLPITE